MPWTPERYPPAMRGLSPLVRLKAIAIANAILAEDFDEGKAIRVGIAKAKEWALHHGIDPGEDPFGAPPRGAPNAGRFLRAIDGSTS